MDRSPYRVQLVFNTQTASWPAPGNGVSQTNPITSRTNKRTINKRPRLWLTMSSKFNTQPYIYTLAMQQNSLLTSHMYRIIPRLYRPLHLQRSGPMSRAVQVEARPSLQDDWLVSLAERIRLLPDASVIPCRTGYRSNRCARRLLFLVSLCISYARGSLCVCLCNVDFEAGI